MSFRVELAPDFAEGESDLHALRYNFKPDGIAKDQPGKLVLSQSQADTPAVRVGLPGLDGAHTHWYQGQQVAAKSTECVLLWDEAKQCYVLHRLATITRLTHTKQAPASLVDSHPAVEQSHERHPSLVGHPEDLPDPTSAPLNGGDGTDMASNSAEDEVPLAATRLPRGMAGGSSKKTGLSRGRIKSAALVDSDDEAEVARPLKSARGTGSLSSNQVLPEAVYEPSAKSHHIAQAATANRNTTTTSAPQKILPASSRSASRPAKGAMTEVDATGSVYHGLESTVQSSLMPVTGQRALKTLPTSVASALYASQGAPSTSARHDGGTVTSMPSSLGSGTGKQSVGVDRQGRAAVPPGMAQNNGAVEKQAARAIPPTSAQTVLTTIGDDDDEEDEDLDFGDLAKQLDAELLSRPAAGNSESESE